MDAPPTTRSAESTAPTSISLSCPKSRMPSPRHKNYQIVPQAKQEKHATEIGMLFVRCGNGGISHSPRETVTAADADIAARTLLDAVVNLDQLDL